MCFPTLIYTNLLDSCYRFYLAYYSICQAICFGLTFGFRVDSDDGLRIGFTQVYPILRKIYLRLRYLPFPPSTLKIRPFPLGSPYHNDFQDK